MSSDISSTTKPGVIDRVGEKLERGWSSTLSRIKPRFSLLTGSVFVLVTLYLPLGVDSCGGRLGTGRDLFLGNLVWNTFRFTVGITEHRETTEEVPRWPSLLGYIYDGPGRWFYIFLISFAVLTLFFVLSTFCFRDTLRKGVHIRPLLAIAGATSLIVLADYGWTVAMAILGAIFDLETPSPAALLCPPLLTAILCAVCLRTMSARPWPPLRLLFVLGAAVTLAGAGLEAYDLASGVTPGATLREAVWFVIPAALYFLSPVLIWLRYGVWCPEGHFVDWLSLRRRLGLIYAPAVAGQFLAAYSAVDSGVWGLIPCLLGIHLITLGYMQVYREANRPLASESVLVPSGRSAPSGV